MKKKVSVKNIKIFNSTINYLKPICLTTLFSVSIVRLFGGGLPFIKDNVVRYKYYSIKGSNYGNTEVIESYRSMDTIFNEIDSSEIVIYSPWNNVDDKYCRDIKTINIDSIDDPLVYDSLVNNNIEYITDKYSDYKLEREYTNKITYKYDTDMYNYDINIFDRNDTYVYEESDARNISIGSMELLIPILIGSAIGSNKNKSLNLSRKRGSNND